MDTIQGNRTNLVVAYPQPGGATADQETIDADGVQQRHDRGVFDHTKSAPLKVKDLEAEQLGEEQPFIRHKWPKPILCWCTLDATRASFTMPDARASRK